MHDGDVVVHVRLPEQVCLQLVDLEAASVKVQASHRVAAQHIDGPQVAQRSCSGIVSARQLGAGHCFGQTFDRVVEAALLPVDLADFNQHQHARVFGLVGQVGQRGVEGLERSTAVAAQLVDGAALAQQAGSRLWSVARRSSSADAKLARASSYAPVRRWTSPIPSNAMARTSESSSLRSRTSRK